MIKKDAKNKHYYQFENTNNGSSLVSFISTRSDGNMAFVHSEPLEVRSNLKNFFSNFNIDLNQSIFARQVHGDNIQVINSLEEIKVNEDGVRTIYERGALITNQKGICINIKTADCVPVFLYDPSQKVIGIVHSGWKGMLLHIVEKTVGKMSEVYNSNPTDLISGIGPSLGPDNFYIRSDVSILFEKDGVDPKHMVRVSDDQWLLNDWEIVKSQLINAGLQEKNVEISGISTYDSQEFFSYRKKEPRGHFITGAMLL